MDVQWLALSYIAHGTPYAPHFAWFLHGFCMWNSLFLRVEQLARFFRTVLHGFCMTCGTACTFFRTVLHGFCTFFSHDMCMWLNPVPLPLFFPVRPYVGSSWRTWRQGGAERAPR